MTTATVNTILTKVYEANAAAWLDPNIKRALNEGGTSSSKTISILQLIDIILEHSTTPMLASVVSKSLPHLKKGAIRDFFNWVRHESDSKGNPNWNMTDHIYTYPNGSKLEFFGADEAGKVHGPRRQILFINEGNEVPWKAANALDVRTERFVFVDWNPVSQFWVHEYESGGKIVQGWIGESDNAYIHSTYLDAIDVLPVEIVEKIEKHRYKDPNWWNIYGLGLLGKIEGLVYPNFQQCLELPDGGVMFYGLDWGYSVDFNVLVRLVIKGDCLYGQELIYEKGLSNRQMAVMMEDCGVKKHHDMIWADGAEPKSIDEIASYGFNIKAAPKGPGSVEYGHSRVREYRQFWTRDSFNCIKNQSNFRYIEDKNGHLTTNTSHQFSHGMDARRYGVAGYLTPIVEDAVVHYDTMVGMDNLELHI